MPPDPTGPPARDRAVVAALVALALLVAVPGVHLFERWMPATTAFVVSHGLALALLATAVVRWRAGRARRAGRRA